MASPATERFVAALEGLEFSGDPAQLVACFTPDAALSNLATREQSEAGAQLFWSSYRRQFADIRSSFTNVIEADGRSALVWTAKGTLSTGQPIGYRGASFLHGQGDRICRFETIYDSAAFVRRPTTT